VAKKRQKKVAAATFRVCTKCGSDHNDWAEAAKVVMPNPGVIRLWRCKRCGQMINDGGLVVG